VRAARTSGVDVAARLVGYAIACTSAVFLVMVIAVHLPVSS